MAIKFANQRRALNFFEQHVFGNEPFFYLVEPAAMGKSSFLSQVANYCTNKDISPCVGHTDGTSRLSTPSSWWVVRVDFSYSRKKNGNQFTVTRLYGSILTEMGVTAPATLDSVLRALHENMNKKGHRALLIFDGAEHLNEEVAVALFNLLRACMKEFEPIPDFRPAALIAARCAFSAWETGYDLQLKKLELSPFVPRDLVEILETARKGDVSWERAVYSEYAQKVFESSMGHPGCTSEIIEQLGTESFRERNPNNDEYFMRVVVPYIEKNILNTGHLANHRKLGATDRELLGRVLRELSTYRIIIPAWIKVAAYRVRPTLSPEELARLGQLIENCPLVSQDYVQHGWLFLSPSVRRLLERWLSLEHGDRELRHREAAKLYRNWLDTHEESAARKSLAPQDSIAILMELLFHLTLGSRLRGRELLSYLQSNLHEYTDGLVPWFPGQKKQLMLKTRLSRDSELRELIIDRTSTKDFETLLTGI